jgi:hypothetical protein
MFKSLFVLAIFFFAQTAEPAILSPQAGQVLRGQIQVTGNLNVENFSSAELSFSYSSDTDTRFPLQAFSQIPADQNLAVWDTTLVSDGDYVLHLRVFFLDGTSQDVTVAGLKIRNDVALPTETVIPTSKAATTAEPSPTATMQPLKAPTQTPVYPTPTNLPPNPVTITPTSIFSYFAQGGLIAIVVIFLFAMILRLRKN